jgi:cell division protein FtsW
MIREKNALLMVTLILLALGVVMVFSSSFISAERSSKFGDGYVFLRKHIQWLMASIAIMLVTMHVDYHFWRRAAPALLAVSCVLLVLVMIPGVGTELNGAKRWFRFGGIGFQPSEFSKLAVVLAFAAMISAEPTRLREFRRGFLPAVAILGLTCGLVMLEPDIGGAFFIGLMGCILLFVGGARILHALPFVAASIPVGLWLVTHKFAHAKDRIAVFLNPELDPLGKGHQIKQALIALGAGGKAGVGLGRSQQKLFFLPERHTDFILAILGEELGFLGTGAVVLLFVVFLWCGWVVARKAPDLLGFLISIGVLLGVAIQALLNVAVVTALIPTKGIGLPFISFGGSGMFFTMAGLGVLLNVASQVEKRKADAEIGILARPEPSAPAQQSVGVRPEEARPGVQPA